MKQDTKFVLDLEALRGLVALLVVWHHSIDFSYTLDPGYVPRGAFAFNAPGHVAVLIFFVLSGYVIGLTNKSPLTTSTILPYIRKRLVRIYPIYLICLALALTISINTYSVGTILGHIAMTQGFFSKLIHEISPSWSLGYEVLFYALFIPLSYFSISPLLVMGAAVLAGLANTYFYPILGPSWISSCCFGLCFWLAGVLLAKPATEQPLHKSYAKMLALILLLLAIGKLNTLNSAMLKVVPYTLSAPLSIPSNDLSQQRAISFVDFSYLPYCLLIIAAFINRRFIYQKIISKLLFLLPLASFYSLFKYTNSATIQTDAVTVAFYLGAVIIYFAPAIFERFAESIMSFFNKTGSISYGLYLVHFSILVVFARVSYFSGSGLTFLVRFIIYLTISIWVAYLLEKKLQPLAKRFLQ